MPSSDYVPINPPSTPGGFNIATERVAGADYQKMINANPLITTFHKQYTAFNSNDVLVPHSAGTVIAVTRVSVVYSGATANAAVVIGFGAASVPSGAGVVFAHSNLPNGQEQGSGDGAGVIGIAQADTEDLRISLSINGIYDVTVTYFPLK